jgi:hypothetical protein
MPMNASERSEDRRETDQAQEHCATPMVHPVPQEHHSDRQTPPGNPVGPHVPDEGAFETFVGGAGI